MQLICHAFLYEVWNNKRSDCKGIGIIEEIAKGMYEYCKLIKKICPLCSDDGKHCGQQTGENEIFKMKKCPREKQRK